MKSKLNGLLEIFLYLVIIRHIIALFTAIPQIGMAISGYGSLLVLTWNIVLHVAMIVILLNLLKIKKWALYLFGGVQLFNIIFQSLFFGKDFWQLTIVATILCSVMAALLCLKKDGISAWNLFFPKKEQQLENDQEQDFKILGEEDIKYEENISVKTTEDEIDNSETTNSEIEDLSLDTLPRKEDGSLDYEKMNPIQQFYYTRNTESIEVALKDLNSDIKGLEKVIAKIKKEINSLSGGNRAKLRDSLREEQIKLDELYELRKKFTTNNTNKKGRKIIITISFVFCTLLCIGYIIYNNKEESKSDENIVFNQNEKTDGDEKKKKLNDKYYISARDKVYDKLKSLGLTDSKEDFLKYYDSDVNVRKEAYKRLRENGLTDTEAEFYEYMKPIETATSTYNGEIYEDDLSILYNRLIEKGYTKEELGNKTTFYKRMSDPDNRKILYEYVKERNDFRIGEFDVYEKRILLSLDMRWLYEKLSVEYEIGDYHTFYNKMLQEEKRKLIHKVAIEEGLELGSWEEFNEQFFY